MMRFEKGLCGSQHMLLTDSECNPERYRRDNECEQVAPRHRRPNPFDTIVMRKYEQERQQEYQLARQRQHD